MHRALPSSTSRSLRYSGFILAALLTVTNAGPVAATRLNSRQQGAAPVNNGLPVNSPSLGQASFTDGGGTGLNLPAILWVVFAGVIGLPLATAGVRGWRVTSGVGGGLGLSLLIWSAFVNTTAGGSLAANPTTSDLFLTLFVWGSFLLGTALGALRVGIHAGVCLLGASAGVSLGILIVLMREGLLIPIYALNAVLVGAFALAGAAWPVWNQRLGVIVSSAACGSFLIGLAVDLVLNKQSGMSLGLRYLLDRNKVHIVATLRVGYKPPLSTVIILASAIGLIPILSFIQHRIFKEPFDRTPESLEEYKRSINGAPVLGPGDEGYMSEKEAQEAFAKTEPQHIELRFPSLVPSLPTQANAQYPPQQQTFNTYGNVPASSGPGVGRRGFVVAAVNAARRMSNTAKRLSTLNVFRGGADRRASTFSTPSVYSVDRNGGAPAQGRYGVIPRPPQDSYYDRGNVSSAYSGVEKAPPVRPLQLPNRQPTANFSNPRGNPPPSAYAPSMRSGRSGYAQPVAAPPPPPAASLRNDTRAQGWRGGGGQRQMPAAPSAGASGMRGGNRGGNPPKSTANRLKPNVKYNML